MALCGGGLFVLAAGCDFTSTEREPEPGFVQVSSAIQSDTICHEKPSGAPLRLLWSQPLVGIESSTTRTLVVQSRDALTVTLFLLSQGLDGRTEQRELQTFDLPAEGEVSLDIAMADLPLQSSTYSSLATVRARFTLPDGSVMFQNAPTFYHHFSTDYDTSYVYDEATMVDQLNHGQLTADAFDLKGRLWRNGEFADLSEVLIELYGGPPPETSGPRVDWADPPGIAATSFSGFPVCVNWQTWFVDASGGDDFVTGIDGTQQVDASRAAYQIGTVANEPCAAHTPDDTCIDVVQEGHLDDEGCLQLPNTSPGETYFIWVYTEFFEGSLPIGSVNHHDENGTDLGIQRHRMSFSIPPEGSPLPPLALLQTGHHPTNHPAAIASMTMIQPDFFDLQLSKIYAKSNHDCPDVANSACALGNFLHTGAWMYPSGDPGPLQYKYIQGHEVGHIIQNDGGANALFKDPNGQIGHYNRFVADNDTLCTCNKVTTSNPLHCLQSRESTSVAQAEGFAHYFAAVLFNDRNGTDCRFKYYKEIEVDYGDLRKPPVQVDCRTPVQWRNNHCGDENARAGTEYDWMQFFWNVAHVSAAPSAPSDIFAIWKRACGHYPGDCKSTDELLWEDPDDPSAPDIVQGTAEHWGLGTSEYLSFISRGEDLGVNDAP